MFSPSASLGEPSTGILIPRIACKSGCGVSPALTTFPVASRSPRGTTTTSALACHLLAPHPRCSFVFRLGGRQQCVRVSDAVSRCTGQETKADRLRNTNSCGFGLPAWPQRKDCLGTCRPPPPLAGRSAQPLHRVDRDRLLTESGYILSLSSALQPLAHLADALRCSLVRGKGRDLPV